MGFSTIKSTTRLQESDDVLLGRCVKTPSVNVKTKGNDYSHVLRNAAEIADKRGRDYGPSKTNFSEIAAICDVTFGLKLTPEEIVKVMLAVKYGREKHKHKGDNLVDVVNYSAILSNMLPK